MVGYSRTSEVSAVVGGSVGTGLDRRVRARRARATGWLGMTSVKAMVLASALVVAGSVQALAQQPPTDPPDPAANKVWGGCVLDQTTTVPNLIEDIKAGPGIDQGNNQVKVSFVVVYTQAYNNNGQPLTGSGFTGPVICRNPAEVAITAEEADGNPLKETTDIPTQTDPGGATSVDILNAEEALVFQHKLNGGSNTGDTQNRFCHTTDANVDCFLIFPP